MRFTNQSTYQKRPITQIINKPLLHKKGKRWIVLSLSALALGIGTVSMNTVNTNSITNANASKVHKVSHHRIHKINTKNVQKRAKALHQRILRRNAKYHHKHYHKTNKRIVKVNSPKKHIRHIHMAKNHKTINFKNILRKNNKKKNFPKLLKHVKTSTRPNRHNLHVGRAKTLKFTKNGIKKRAKMIANPQTLTANQNKFSIKRNHTTTARRSRGNYGPDPMASQGAPLTVTLPNGNTIPIYVEPQDRDESLWQWYDHKKSVLRDGSFNTQGTTLEINGDKFEGRLRGTTYYRFIYDIISKGQLTYNADDQANCDFKAVPTPTPSPSPEPAPTPNPNVTDEVTFNNDTANPTNFYGQRGSSDTIGSIPGWHFTPSDNSNGVTITDNGKEAHFHANGTTHNLNIQQDSQPSTPNSSDTQGANDSINFINQDGSDVLTVNNCLAGQDYIDATGSDNGTHLGGPIPNEYINNILQQQGFKLDNSRNNGQTFPDSGNSQFTFNNGSHNVYIMGSNMGTTYVMMYNQNGNPVGQPELLQGPIGSQQTAHIPVPSGYHLASDSDESVTIGQDKILKVIPNQQPISSDVTENVTFVYSNGQPNKTIQINGKRNTTKDMSSDIPEGYDRDVNDPVNIPLDGQTHYIHLYPKQPSKNSEFVQFVDKNGNNIGLSNQRVSGNVGSDASVNAPKGYHFISGDNGSVPIKAGNNIIVQQHVAKNDVQETVHFTDKNGKDLGLPTQQVSGIWGTNVPVQIPNNYQPINGNTVPIKQEGGDVDLPLTQDTNSESVQFVDKNGNSLGLQNEAVYGNVGSDASVNAPKGYHFISGDNGSVPIKAGDNVVVQQHVAKNNVQETVHFTDKSGKDLGLPTQQVSGTWGTNVPVQIPNNYHPINGNTVPIKQEGGNVDLPLARDTNSESVQFVDKNGNSLGLSDQRVSGNVGSDATVKAPRGYHFTNGDNGSVPIKAGNNVVVQQHVTRNIDSAKIILHLNYFKNGNINHRTTINRTISGAEFDNGTYIVDPYKYVNNNSQDSDYAPTHSDSNIILHPSFNQSNNGTASATLNFNHTNIPKPKVAPKPFLPYKPSINNPKVPSDWQPNKPQPQPKPKANTDKINFIYNNQNVGSTTSKGKVDSVINLNNIQAPKGYKIAPNQSLIYDGQSHNVKVVKAPSNNIQPKPTPTPSKIIIHNDKELDDLAPGKSGFYNGHKVTKVNSNFNHWRYLWALKPYIVHSSFLSVSNPNKDRVERITPQMRRTYHIKNIFIEYFGKAPVLRYEINYGHNQGRYYVTGNPSYTDNSYYDEHNNYNSKNAKVEKTVYEYAHINQTYVNTLHKGDIVQLKNIKNISKYPVNRLTRFQLSDGNWVSANKNCLTIIK